MQRFHEIGDRVVLEMPASEVCMYMRVTGQRKTVEIREHGAQILNDDGSLFSSPITWGEAGIYTDRTTNRPYTNEDRKNSRGQHYEPSEFRVITPAGQTYGRDPSLEDCIASAKRLGKGAKVEGLDKFLNPTGDIIHEVE